MFNARNILWGIFAIFIGVYLGNWVAFVGHWGLSEGYLGSILGY